MNKYAKFISADHIEWAPLNKIGGPGEPSYSPYPEDLLIEDGYRPVIESPMPDDGQIYSESWELVNNEILNTWTVVPDTRTPAEKRQEAYSTVPYIEYGDKIYTVDEAEQLYYQYFCELNKQDVCEFLQRQITFTKNRIRNTYPDNESVIEDE